MDSFRWIAVAISMILGIGVTRLLGSAVVIVKNRDRFQLDALPILWATFVFIAQIQFWWAIIELSRVMSVWTLADFIVVLSMPLALYVAAALILPNECRESDLSLRSGFERDGRLGLVALAFYNAVAWLVDAAWWNSNLLSWNGVLLGSLAILPLGVFVAPKRSHLAIAVVYGVLLVFCGIDFSPAAY